MNHFTYISEKPIGFSYSYNHQYQTLIRLSPSGEELQRFFIPTSDLEKVIGILFAASADKLFTENE